MNTLSIARLSTLPPLAWLVSLEASKSPSDSPSEPLLICGQSIEIQEYEERMSFFEGCWAGEYTKGELLDNANFFGSGGSIAADGTITFATSTHTLDTLFVLRDRSQYIVSNSLAFLIRFAGLEVTSMLSLPKKVATVLRGLDSSDVVIHQQDSLRIERYVYTNLEIAGEKIRLIPKLRPPKLTNYKQYYEYVMTVLGAAKENAQHPQRRKQYELLTTCSAGYDSVAGAVLASKLGCREAISLKNARFGLEDSGKPVADKLGLECTEWNRPQKASSDSWNTGAESLASFCPGDSVFHVFDGKIEGRLLITGHHGDKVWSLKNADTDPFRRSGGGSGMGLHELRLRNDCIVVPIPYIGSFDQPSITQISRSPELAPYRVGGSYDRPIPRRIAEDAGIERHLFGQRKAVVSLAFYEWRFRDKTLKTADEFIQTVTGPMFWILEQLYRWVAIVLNAGINLPSGNGYLSFIYDGIRQVCLRLMNRYRWIFQQRPYRDYITLWAIAEVGKRYPLRSEIEEV